MLRKSKVVPLPLWATATNDGIERCYIRIGSSFMLHESVLGLNPSAFRLYVYMMHQCRGKAEFTMPYSAYKGFMTKPTFSKALKELERLGFIETTERNGRLRKPNKYRFSKQYREGT